VDGADALKVGSHRDRVRDGTPFDLIILDLDMPRMDGRSDDGGIEDSDATARILVVILTGATSETAEPDFDRAGSRRLCPQAD
jgi:CheY-like chemotaxis protein